MSNIHEGLRILTSQSEETSMNMWGIQPRHKKIHLLELKLKKKKEEEEKEGERDMKLITRLKGHIELY